MFMFTENKIPSNIPYKLTHILDAASFNVMGRYNLDVEKNAAGDF